MAIGPGAAEWLREAAATGTARMRTTLRWVDRHENLCVCGPSGTGKSHFCEALGQAAIDSGRSVAWFAIAGLGALVRRHRAYDSITKAIARLTRVDLVIVDDIGMLPVGADAAEGFYRLVYDAGRSSPEVLDHLPQVRGHCEDTDGSMAILVTRGVGELIATTHG